jgi:predicted MFS family arabinose efflux permease
LLRWPRTLRASRHRSRSDLDVEAGDVSIVRPRQRTWRTLLRHREFGGLWWSASVSTIGDQFAAVAVAVLVYRDTGQPALSALVYSISLWAPLVGTPTLGFVADRWPRRTVMVAGAGVQALLLGVMAVPGVPLPVLGVLLLLALMVSTPYQAAADATMAVAVEPADYPAGMALRTVGLEFGQLVGLGTAGVLVTAVGAGPVLAADAGTFVLAAILMAVTGKYRPSAAPRPAVPAVTSQPPPVVAAAGAATDSSSPDTQPAPVAGRRGPPAGGKWVAWSVIQHDPELRTLLWLRLIAGLAVVPEGIAVALAAQLGAPWAAGLLLAIEPAAVLLGTTVLHALADESTRLKLLGPLTVTSVAVLLLLVAGPRWAIVIPALVLSGLAASYHVPAGTRWGQVVPDEYRGRVHAFARPILRAVQGAGMAGGGVVAGLVGSATTAIAAAGGVGVLLAIPAAWAWSRAQAATRDQNSRFRMTPTSLSNRDGPAT